MNILVPLQQAIYTKITPFSQTSSHPKTLENQHFPDTTYTQPRPSRAPYVVEKTEQRLPLLRPFLNSNLMIPSHSLSGPVSPHPAFDFTPGKR